MLFDSAIFVLSFANKVVKVEPRKFVRSLYGVPRTLQYFGILAENFGDMLEILRTFLRYFGIILWKCLEYFHEISRKLLFMSK